MANWCNVYMTLELHEKSAKLFHAFVETELDMAANIDRGWDFVPKKKALFNGNSSLNGNIVIIQGEVKWELEMENFRWLVRKWSRFCKIISAECYIEEWGNCVCGKHLFSNSKFTSKSIPHNHKIWDKLDSCEDECLSDMLEELLETMEE